MAETENSSDPGSPSVLYSQNKHVSGTVYTFPDKLREFRTRCQHVKKPLPDSVRAILVHSGFGGLLPYRYGNLDARLLAAAVERWRPETHTFHFPFGEATITLQDVHVLFGLPVDGLPVICNIGGGNSVPWWQDKVEDLLGARPPSNEFKSGSIRRDWIEQNVCEIDPGNDVAAQIRFARGYALMLLGCRCMADHSGDKVPLKYLPLLENLHNCPQYAWGAAVLASTYEGLCACARGTNGELVGSAVLVYLWLVSRLRCISPVGLHLMTPSPGQVGDPPFYPQSLAATLRRQNPCQILRQEKHFRNQLAKCKESEFIWQPYLGYQVPAAQEIWRIRVPLICFSTIKTYYPDRVLRQFGGFQHIPTATDKARDEKAHKDRKSTKVHTNYMHDFSEELQSWGQRLQTVVNMDVPGEGQPNKSHLYKSWYREHTRRRTIPRKTPGPQQRGFIPDAPQLRKAQSALSKIKRWFVKNKHEEMLPETHRAFEALNLSSPDISPPEEAPSSGARDPPPRSLPPGPSTQDRSPPPPPFGSGPYTHDRYAAGNIPMGK